MLVKIIKKIVGKSSNEQGEKEPGQYSKVKQKTEEIIVLAKEKYSLFIEEFFNIKAKLNNLKQVNYDLGMKHLNNGYLGDALFRFRFITVVWPDFYEAYRQLAYCLILQKRYDSATIVLKKLMIKDPESISTYQELLEQVEILSSQDK